MVGQTAEKMVGLRVEQMVEMSVDSMVAELEAHLVEWMALQWDEALVSSMEMMLVKIVVGQMGL